MVHTTNNFGDLTDDVNEYLTSVYMSINAFKDLISYFNESERDVIICMVGDHAPSFISEISDYSIKNVDIYQKAVPYIIWSNFEIKGENREFVSMTDVLPILLYNCNLPLSPFYSYIVDMSKTIPIRTKSGVFLDVYNNIYSYNSKSKYYDLISKYYFMEYNALNYGSDYYKELFYAN